jgi:hypothetical protein
LSVYIIDCEFNGFGGDLISMALVRQDGAALSMVVGCNDPTPWVAENVMPHLFADPYSRSIQREEIPAALTMFLIRDPEPVIVADWPEDIIHFCQCLMPSPGQMVPLSNLTFRVIRGVRKLVVEGAIEHNCYWDAEVARQTFMG